jgi:hypothetical protein
MRVLQLIILSLLLFSCGNKSPRVSSITYNAFLIRNSGDTINRLNEKGRQGHWVFFYEGPENNSAFTLAECDTLKTSKPKSMTGQIMKESGEYSDNKKQGTWSYYNIDGSLNRTMEFKDDLPVKK